jgi:hypothetical protein
LVAPSDCRIKPTSLPSTITRLDRPIPPGVHSADGREHTSSPFTKKCCMFWRSADVRSTWLHPATAGSSRPHPRRLRRVSAGHPAQSAPSERREAFFQPFCSKSLYVLAVCWYEVSWVAPSACRSKPTSLASTVTRIGRSILPRVHPVREGSLLSALLLQKAGFYFRVCLWRSPRQQPTVTGSSRYHPRRLSPVSAGQSCPRCTQEREESLPSALLHQKPIWSAGLTVGCCQGSGASSRRIKPTSTPSTVIPPRVHSGGRISLLWDLMLQKAGFIQLLLFEHVEPCRALACPHGNFSGREGPFIKRCLR